MGIVTIWSAVQNVCLSECLSETYFLNVLIYIYLQSLLHVKNLLYPIIIGLFIYFYIHILSFVVSL